MTKEKTEQKNLNIEMEAIEQQLIEGINGTIKEINEKTNLEYYGVDTYNTRKGVEIIVLLDQGEEISEWYSTEVDPRGLKQSNIYKFKLKYGKYPEVGMSIKAILNEEGFFRIDK